MIVLQASTKRCRSSGSCSKEPRVDGYRRLPKRVTAAVYLYVRLQCDSIHGRAPARLFEPSAWTRALLLIRGPVGRNPADEARLGLSAARSLIICPVRARALSVDSCGTLNKLRGDTAPHIGQSHGSEKRLIGGGLNIGFLTPYFAIPSLMTLTLTCSQGAISIPPQNVISPSPWLKCGWPIERPTDFRGGVRDLQP